MVLLGANVVMLTIALIVQQALHARERAILLDRIQAPDRAPYTQPKVDPIDPADAAEARRNLELVMAPDA